MSAILANQKLHLRACNKKVRKISHSRDSRRMGVVHILFSTSIGSDPLGDLRFDTQTLGGSVKVVVEWTFVRCAYDNEDHSSASNYEGTKTAPCYGIIVSYCLTLLSWVKVVIEFTPSRNQSYKIRRNKKSIDCLRNEKKYLV